LHVPGSLTSQSIAACHSSASEVQRAEETFYKHVVPRGIIHPAHIISQNDLGARITGIALAAEKFGYILDILVASIELILGAGVVDSYEKGFLAH
jgi:hypothetical protein